MDIRTNRQKQSYLGFALLMQLTLFLMQSLAANAIYAATKSYAAFLAFSSVTAIPVFSLPLYLYKTKTGRPAMIREELSRPITNFPKHAPLKALFVIFSVCAVISTVNVFGMLTDAAFALIGAERSAVLPQNTLELVLLFIKTVILAPILEELLFRIAVIDAFNDCTQIKKAALSATLFALMHYSLFQIPYALAAGLVISLFVLKTNSFAYGIAIHGAANLTTFVFTVLSLNLSENVYIKLSTVFSLIFLTITAAGAVTLFVRSKSKADIFRAEKTQKDSFIAPELIAFAIIALAISLMSV